MGVVAPNLDIKALRTAVKILPGTQPTIYLAPNGSGAINGGLSPNGGFSDLDTRNLVQAHKYTFTFAPGTSVSSFSLHMLDFGDWNPSVPPATNHLVSLIASDVNGNVVSNQELNYTTLAQQLPHSSSLFGDLLINGDAASSSPGQLGNWTWHIFGSGITKVVLEFGVGFDPNVAFDTLTFCP